MQEDSDFEYLERCINGQWYRLNSSAERGFAHLEFVLGGESSSSLQGSLVQKYAGYGTRLEPGAYRLVLEMRDADGTVHYLAAEFAVD